MEILSGLGIEVWVALFSAIGGLFKAIKFVHEGELGIKLRWGKAVRNADNSPRIINPGFVFLIPFVETLKRRHVRQQTQSLNNQTVMIKRSLTFNVNAVVMFRVKDIYRALFEIDDLDSSIIDLSMGVLRDVLSDKDHCELSDMEKISGELLEKLKEKGEEWGVTFIQFKLTSCAPTSETAPLINAEAGVRLKMDALKSAAEDMGVEVYLLPPVFAAALVGVPLVTSINSEVNVTQETKRPIFSLSSSSKSKGEDDED